MYINNPYANDNLYRLLATSYSITVNVAARTMTLYKNRKTLKTYPIAIGKPSTPTPRFH